MIFLKKYDISMCELQEVGRFSLREYRKEQIIMRMKKRIFAGVLAASMVVAAFTGCNNDDSAKLSDYSEYVTLGEYKNLDIEVGKADVTDKQMQDAIAEVIKKNTTKEEIKEGIVKDKDSINLDFTGYLDGEAFENGSAKAYDYTVGGGFIKSLNDQLIGLEVGKEYDLDCKFPDDYGVEKLNGQDVVFKVKVNCIYGKDIVPEWNDELVKKASEGKYTTVEAYEKYLKDSLKEQNLAEQKSEYEYEMWAAIIKNCKRNGYPEEQLEKLYNEYYSYYKEYYSYIASYYGQKYDDYLKAMGTTDEKLKDKCMTSAKAELEYMMVSVEIAKVENVEITDEEYESIAEGIVKEYGYDSVDKFEEEYASYGENYLYESFIFDEVNEMLAEANNMVEVDKKTNDKENTEKETEKETEKATSGSEEETTTAAKEEATTEAKKEEETESK